MDFRYNRFRYFENGKWKAMLEVVQTNGSTFYVILEDGIKEVYDGRSC